MCVSPFPESNMPCLSRTSWALPYGHCWNIQDWTSSITPSLLKYFAKLLSAQDALISFGVRKLVTLNVISGQFPPSLHFGDVADYIVLQNKLMHNYCGRIHLVEMHPGLGSIQFRIGNELKLSQNGWDWQWNWNSDFSRDTNWNWNWHFR